MNKETKSANSYVVSSKERTEKFLADVKEQKIQQLLGIALDVQYWEGVVKDSGSEEQLRKDFSKESNKRVLTKEGKVFSDTRDLDKINALQEKIDLLAKAKEELARLKIMDSQIRKYLAHIISPSAVTLKALEAVSKL